ncbi:XRE family transcriptional regulator [Sinorhizobium fredii]|nr:XRE family transcriptional regulator [Sinorhizobium fredii]
MQDVDGLQALRQITGKGQADIAAALRIKQPSVSKIEKQADMHISTLRSYVEAIGGELELTVRLPNRPAVRIHALGEVATAIPEKLAPAKLLSPRPQTADNPPVHAPGEAIATERRKSAAIFERR